MNPLKEEAAMPKQQCTMQPLTGSEREKKNRVSRTKWKAISENLGGNSHSKSQTSKTSKNNYRRFWWIKKCNQEKSLFGHQALVRDSNDQEMKFFERTKDPRFVHGRKTMRSV
jgi:hypothetical protein